MATIRNCEFCGTVVTHGFLGFGGTAKKLYLGEGHTLTCCPECAKKYSDFVDFDDGRFGIKVENMLRHSGRTSLSQSELLQHFNTYYNEAKIYLQENPLLNDSFYSNNFAFGYERGRRTDVAVFSTRESLLSEQSIEDVVEAFEDALGDNFRELYSEQEVDKMTGAVRKKAWPFTGADMTHLGFNSTGLTMSENTLTGIRWTYLLRISLNDPAVITYKPAVINGLVMFKTKLLKDDELMSQLVMDSVNSLAAELGGDLELVEKPF